MKQNEPLRYFLGANTPAGFVSKFDGFYDCLDGWRVFILKGGPGTGKSTLMKKVAEAVDCECEYIYCSSDPRSLDAVIFNDLKTAIADGTAPHVWVHMHRIKRMCLRTQGR